MHLNDPYRELYRAHRQAEDKAAKEKWDEAHPFLCSAHPSKDYHSLSLKFIEQHFELFSTMQFTTSAGWEHNEKTGKMDWVYNSRYVKVN
jgi:hypothetical protein